MTTQNRSETIFASEGEEAVQSPTLFRPGQVFATPGAIETMQANDCLSLDLLLRHLAGDWGSIPEEDAQANHQALTEGYRILSSYPMKDGSKIWIITEADRSSTTFLLPEEY